MWWKKAALLTAFAAIIGGVGVSFLTHTREAASARLAATPWHPLVQEPELSLFPVAGQWRVLYRMSQGAWYDANHGKRRIKHIEPTAEDRYIEHIFAYLPAGVPCNLGAGAEPLPRSSAMMLNRCLRLAKLPQARTSVIAAAGKRRFYPNENDPNSLWYEVTYFRLKDGVTFLELTRIPYSLLQPERYRAIMSELRAENEN